MARLRDSNRVSRRNESPCVWRYPKSYLLVLVANEARENKARQSARRGEVSENRALQSAHRAGHEVPLTRGRNGGPALIDLSTEDCREIWLETKGE